MQVLSTIREARTAIAELRRQGRSIGLVPTMGALHAAHRSLIDEAVTRCDAVAVSIFVNPTQFGPGEDYERYPRTLEADLTICREAGAALVFAPKAKEMYPDRFATSVHVAKLTERLCGAHRPGHFDGVTTVVAKLFNALTPDMAFFGEKDYQQLKVIERMTRDLDMPIEIVACPTIREDDGLAISSRNRYLSAEQRTQALSLSKSMREAARRIAEGQRDAGELIRGMERQILKAGPARIDYIAIVDPETLQSVEKVCCPARICMAVRIGNCRLIDNLAVNGGNVGG